MREAVFTFTKNDEKLEQFIVELLQTELKDTQSTQVSQATSQQINLQVQKDGSSEK